MSQSYRKEFINPYNFVPAPRRSRKKSDKELGNRSPSGHHLYDKSLWSGSISVNIKAETNILVPDASREEWKKDHPTMPVRLDKRGRACLSMDQIKGMLRSEYEAITNSPFGVDPGHDQLLGYRRPALGKNLIPARVEIKDGKTRIRLMPYQYEKPNEGDLKYELNVASYAPRLPRYSKFKRKKTSKGTCDTNESTAGLKYSTSKTLPKHGEAVWVDVKKKGYERTIKKIWPRSVEKKHKAPSPTARRGWACVTGPNIKDKAYERVFIESDTDQYVTLSDTVVERWQLLIEDCLDTHEAEMDDRRRKRLSAQDYLGDDPGKTAFSRHAIASTQASKLRTGDLIYAYITPPRSDVPAKPIVRELYPVTISRALFEKTPRALLEYQGLLPSASKSALSPAERVFGWSNPNGDGSYAGQFFPISLKRIDSSDDEGDGDQEISLAILGLPKAANHRFYLALNGGKDIQTNGAIENPRAKGYSSDRQGGRGFKVYPHHRGAAKLKNYWPKRSTPLPNIDKAISDSEGKKFFTEYLMPPGNNSSKKSSQNRTIQGWIGRGAEFEFQFKVKNLSGAELGALLWLLTLPDEHFHRIGYAKPLGFGSARVELTALDLKKGVMRAKEIQGFYKKRLNCAQNTLVGNTDDAGFEAFLKNRIEPFKKKFIDALEQVQPNQSEKILKAFLQNACGGNKDLPVHYPRLSPKPSAENKNFDWFSNNDNMSTKTLGLGLALPALWTGDLGLPCSPSGSASRNSRSRKKRPR